MSDSLTPFAFDDSLVRVSLDKAGSPWFVAKDVCAVLELGDTSKAVERLDEDEKGTNTIRTPGGQQNMLVISESGLYSLVFTSRKPEAKRFRKWVTSEVLPSLRKTGRYRMQDSMSPAVITASKLKDLVAIWAMLAGMPRVALLEQLMARHDIRDIETAAPDTLQAAGVFVLRQNDALLRKGRQISREAAREYQVYRQGEPEEPEAVTTFWQQYDQLNAKLGPNGERGWLNHSRIPGQIAINFNQFIEACRRHCQLAPDMPSLRKLLPESYPRRFVAANRGVYSKHAKKNMRCWVFQETCCTSKA